MSVPATGDVLLIRVIDHQKYGLMSSFPLRVRVVRSSDNGSCIEVIFRQSGETDEQERARMEFGGVWFPMSDIEILDTLKEEKKTATIHLLKKV